MVNCGIISACAASKRNVNPDRYSMFTNHSGGYYYGVIFRMYIHFNRIVVVHPGEEEAVGSYFAPFFTNPLITETVEANTVVKQHTFMVDSALVNYSIDEYVRRNIDKYLQSKIWEMYKEEIIEKYISDINKKYNIKLDKSYIDYSTQFVWEIASTY